VTLLDLLPEYELEYSDKVTVRFIPTDQLEHADAA
jgi:hypothetical protein